jgi:transcriptional regulator with XRE-family HTH domain
MKATADRPSARARSLPLLRAVVAATGRTHRDLAGASGVAHSTFSNIMVGRRNPSAEVAQRICQTLRVPVDLLFEICISDDIHRSTRESAT